MITAIQAQKLANGGVVEMKMETGKIGRIERVIRKQAINGNDYTGDHHSTCYYLTDSNKSKHMVNESGFNDEDRQIISKLRENGFSVTFTSANENYSRPGWPDMDYGIKISWKP